MAQPDTPGLCGAGTRGSCPERGKDSTCSPSAPVRAMSIAHNLISTLFLPRDGTTIPPSHSQPSPVVLTGLEHPAGTNSGWGRSQNSVFRICAPSVQLHSPAARVRDPFSEEIFAQLRFCHPRMNQFTNCTNSSIFLHHMAFICSRQWLYGQLRTSNHYCGS